MKCTQHRSLDLCIYVIVKCHLLSMNGRKKKRRQVWKIEGNRGHRSTLLIVKSDSHSCDRKYTNICLKWVCMKFWHSFDYWNCFFDRFDAVCVCVCLCMIFLFCPHCWYFRMANVEKKHFASECNCNHWKNKHQTEERSQHNTRM